MFKLMKDGSVFINVGRGNTVNQKDLEECVEKFRGVALDVFESEPLNKDNIHILSSKTLIKVFFTTSISIDTPYFYTKSF